MLRYTDNTDSPKRSWPPANPSSTFYATFSFGFFNKTTSSSISSSVVSSLCASNFPSDHSLETPLEWTPRWRRAPLSEMSSCMESPAGGWVVFLDMGGARGTSAEVGIGVEDEGPGSDISRRAWSILSRVDSAREVTSSTVRPVVGIGGSTTTVVSYIVQWRKAFLLTSNLENTGLKPCASVEESVIVFTHDRDNRNLSLDRKVESTLFERKEGRFRRRRTCSLGEDPKRDLVYLSVRYQYAKTDVKTYALLLHVLASNCKGLNCIMSIFSVDKYSSRERHY